VFTQFTIPGMAQPFCEGQFRCISLSINTSTGSGEVPCGVSTWDICSCCMNNLPFIVCISILSRGDKVFHAYASDGHISVRRLVCLRTVSSLACNASKASLSFSGSLIQPRASPSCFLIYSANRCSWRI